MAVARHVHPDRVKPANPKLDPAGEQRSFKAHGQIAKARGEQRLVIDPLQIDGRPAPGGTGA